MLTRRDLLKKSSFVWLGLSLGPIAVLNLIGCPSTDQVMDGLKIAANVAINTSNILKPVNLEMFKLSDTIASDLNLIVKTYQDYEVIVDTVAKQNAVNLIQATIVGISNNLAALLEAVHVKNPTLITVISVSIAVINSAITILANKLPASTVTMTQALVVGVKDLPILRNAKSANDLKNAWNNVVKIDYPQAKI